MNEVLPFGEGIINAVLDRIFTYKRATIFGGVMVIGFGLGGCMSLSDVTGPFKMFSSKQETKPVVVTKNLSAPHIHISSTTGMPPGWNTRIHSHIQEASRQLAVPLSTSTTSDSDHQLVGHVSAADISSGTLIAYVWDIQDEKGKRLHRISGQKSLGRKGPRGAWSGINDQTLRLIAEETATNIRGWMTAQGYSLQPADITTAEKAIEEDVEVTPQETIEATPSVKPIATPRRKPPVQKTATLETEGVKVASLSEQPLPAPGKKIADKKTQPQPKIKKQTSQSLKSREAETRPGLSSQKAPSTSFVYVGSVNGARGDGNAELTRAIISSLAKNGLGISPTPQPAGYKLEGKVKIETAKDGQDQVLLNWAIRTADGTLIGTVSQKNQIKSGSFNKTWGQTAFLAADAAAGSIKLVIDKREKQKI